MRHACCDVMLMKIYYYLCSARLYDQHRKVNAHLMITHKSEAMPYFILLVQQICLSLLLLTSTFKSYTQRTASYFTRETVHCWRAVSCKLKLTLLLERFLLRSLEHMMHSSSSYSPIQWLRSKFGVKYNELPRLRLLNNFFLFEARTTPF
jgi:hypothetical protein